MTFGIDQLLGEMHEKEHRIREEHKKAKIEYCKTIGRTCNTCPSEWCENHPDYEKAR